MRRQLQDAIGSGLSTESPDRARQDIARVRIAAVIDRMPDLWTALHPVQLLLGEMEQELHGVSESRPTLEVWPRHSRPVYDEALILVYGATKELTDATTMLRQLERSLEQIERARGVTAAAWLATLPTVLRGAGATVARIEQAVGAAEVQVQALGNLMRRVTVDNCDTC